MFKMKNFRNALFAAIFVLVGTATFSYADETARKFFIDDPVGRNSVTFKSEAPLEDMVGTTNQITGFIQFNPDNPTAGAEAELSVPVASLNTGIPVRDEHMRSANWLNAESHPQITLKINSVKEAKIVKEMDNAKTFDLTVSGEFTLRGITRPVEFPARVTFFKENESTKMRLAGDLLAVRGTFFVPLADYKITGPEGMTAIGSKISDNIEVSVNIMGGSTDPSLAQKKK